MLPDDGPILSVVAPAGKSWRLRGQVANALLHPIKLATVTWHQMLRDRVNGRMAADVVLVELSRAHIGQK
jgi:hypothetical protein